MKKVKFKNLLISFCLLFILFLFNNVKASSINNITMEIHIDNNGNAKVTEIWDCNVTEGSESYHPYYNLGNSQIKDLSVKEKGRSYTNVGTWNTSGNMSSKAYKCGINKITDGVELCWGISNYGKHKYEVQYTITSFIAELTECQMIYWTLMPHNFSNEIKNFDLKIYADDYYMPDSIDVWGYGKYGAPIYVYNGHIEYNSKNTVKKDEYVTILAKFPLNTFKSSNILNNSFDYYYNMAEEDSKHYNDDYVSTAEVLLITLIFGVVFTITWFVITRGIAYIISWISLKIKGIPKQKLYVKIYDKRSIQIAPYYRDIPCENDLLKAYFIASQYKLVKNKYDVLGSMVLKWIKDGLVKLEKRPIKKLFKNEQGVFILNNNGRITDPIEKELFNLLYKASNGDGVLEEKEFKSWFKAHNDRIPSWIERIRKDYINKFIETGLIKVEEKKILGIFKSTRYYPDKSITEEAIKLSGLKKYLKDYTLIKEREPIEVHLFEQYMIYAQFMGISKKVAKRLKMIYPAIVEQSSFNSYENIDYIKFYTRRGVFISNINNLRDEAIERARNYSSGGGGYSSGGGGGGSFGGGGRRWRLPLKKVS